MSLQLGQTRYEKITAMNCPIMIIELEKDTIQPLIELGVSSDKQIGTTYEAIPIPIPANNLPNINSNSFSLQHITTEPTKKKKLVIINTFYLPILSLMTPENRLPIIAPNIAMDVIVS